MTSSNLTFFVSSYFIVCVARFVAVSSEQQYLSIILTWKSFFHTKAIDTYRVREHIKHEDKFGTVINIEFYKKFQKLQYSFISVFRINSRLSFF